jgi:hypothetical protein
VFDVQSFAARLKDIELPQSKYVIPDNCLLKLIQDPRIENVEPSVTKFDVVTVLSILLMVLKLIDEPTEHASKRDKEYPNVGNILTLFATSEVADPSFITRRIDSILPSFQESSTDTLMASRPRANDLNDKHDDI